MPSKAPRFCTTCRQVHAGRCPKRKAWSNRREGNTTQRGYGHRWRKLRAVIMERDCGLCQQCKDSGRLTEAVAACRALLLKGPRLVLLTSLLRRDGPPDGIEMLAVTADSAWRVATPRFVLNPAPNGAGDLTAALFLAMMIESRDPQTALARTAAAVHAVFSKTAEAGTRELALVAAQDLLRDPPDRFAVDAV